MAALTVDFRKHSGPTPADDMAAQIITDWKLHNGLQATWILCLSTPPPDSGTLISLIWKDDFGPLSNSPVIFLLSPGKMLLMLFLFQKWLGSSFPEDVWAWWLLIHWLQLQFTPCEALPSVWIGFVWQYSQACGHPCCLCTFSYPISSFQSTLHLICFDTALLEQPPFSNDPLWLTLFVEGVNDCLLDHCQVSSVPQYCGFKEQESHNLYCMDGHLLKLKFILIFWDTDFFTLISCKL